MMSTHIDRWLSGRRLLALLFVFSCLLFGPLYHAGFVTDFTGWLECHADTPVWRAYTCFGFSGLYVTAFIVLGFLTNLFWLHPLPWFIAWVGLHAINAYLVIDVCRRLVDAFKVQVAGVVPLLAGLIFLLHPWQVEVLAWKACANYLTACILMLLTLRYYLKWYSGNRRVDYWISVAMYFGFLFALEFALLFPLVIVALHWLVMDKKGFRDRLVELVKTISPFIAALGIWFVANKLLLGVWIGHYRAETHFALDIVDMSSTVLKYLVKILVLSRMFSFPLQTDVYAILSQAWVGWIMLGIFAMIAIVVLVHYSRLSRMLSLRLFLIIAGIICIVPVTNLYFYYLQYSENDRYTYLAIAFLGMWIPLLLWGGKNRLGKGIVVAYMLVCFWAAIKHVRIWEKSTEAYWHHIETFTEPEQPKVFLLNVPDNYHGTFMFRNYGGDSAFDEVWRWIGKSDYSGKMYDVFQYNMTDPDNDFIVSWESPNKLKVEFAQWGNWWWRNGIGAEKYGNAEYIAWPEGKFYFVEFKQPLQDVLIRYHGPDGWHDVSIPDQIQ